MHSHKISTPQGMPVPVKEVKEISSTDELEQYNYYAINESKICQLIEIPY